jgi:chemotaxis protein MotA
LQAVKLNDEGDRVDFLTLVGVLVAGLAVVGGFWLEGGQVTVLLQWQSALIVIGGTLGAVMIQNPWARFADGFKLLFWVFSSPKPVDRKNLSNLLDWGKKAKQGGLLALESVNTEQIGDFAGRGLQLLANGVSTPVIDDALRRELDAYERSQMAAAKIWQQAGGYAPTFGIVGAVLGLIHITGNIASPGELGKGISMAFVSTLYGVGIANVVFLPVYGKIKSLVENELRYRKLYLDGILSISRKESSNIIETRLLGDIRQRANEHLG